MSHHQECESAVRPDLAEMMSGPACLAWIVCGVKEREISCRQHPPYL